MKTPTLALICFLAATTGTWSAEDQASDTAAAEGSESAVLQAEDTASLEDKVGEEVVVEGVIRNVGKGPNDGITFLNFGEGKKGFVAVIFSSAYDNFPDGFDQYADQKVRVKGSLEKYQDRQIQIKIFTPDQLEVVTDAP
ncbi:MAG: OB-fold nucleic acid binding domain-containing protein [Chthoniobacterales bacterium]